MSILPPITDVGQRIQVGIWLSVYEYTVQVRALAYGTGLIATRLGLRTWRNSGDRNLLPSRLRLRKSLLATSCRREVASAE